MKQKQSIVFVAEESDGILSGFVQLYPSFCSVSAIPVLILYDLFVDEEERGKGIGRNLMNKSTEYAKLNGFKRLELSTAKDNVIGQSLYESLDYELDEEFLHYSLEVK
jgi:ribosomal protein S18 acetylase RimI-like enzyme